MPELDKKYYRIRDVSELIGVPQSTLRYWEREFPMCRPRRSSTNIRYYTPEDIEKLRIVHYLLKVKGLKLEAAKEQMRVNSGNMARNVKAIAQLTEVRDTLEGLLKSLTKRH